MEVDACRRLPRHDLSANLDQRLEQAFIVGVDIVVVATHLSHAGGLGQRRQGRIHQAGGDQQPAHAALHQGQ